MEVSQAKHLNRKVAISVAIISTFMAISKVKDDNIVQAMMQAKSDSVDTWNQYQSKKIKQHIAEAALEQNKILKLVVPNKSLSIVAGQDQLYAQNIERYSSESNGLMEKAKDFEKSYDTLNFTDDQFDLSDACFSLALMLLAVAALTAEVWLLKVSWVIACMGFLLGISGFTGWRIHPDWLVRLLT